MAKNTRKYADSKAVKTLVEQRVDEVRNTITDEELYIRIGEGNTKLQGQLTFAITPVLTCKVGATDACIYDCYAVKDYKRHFTNVAKSQLVNWEMAKRPDFAPRMIEAIEQQLARPKYQDKHVEFRIHVAGDFFSYSYFKAWIFITKHFEGRNISFGCYTKSITFIKSYLKETGSSLADININFMASVWHDSSDKYLDMVEELDMHIFTAYDAKNEQLPSGYIQCQDDVEEKACGRTCNLCYEKDQDKLLSDKWTDNLNEAYGRKKIAIGIH